MPTLTYTSNGTFSTATNISASISCWGAGGDGNANGTGGSGGSYASRTLVLQSGSYAITVGQSNEDGLGNGGNSSFTSASAIIVRAAGGKSDGTIAHQASLNTGSTTYVGGTGASFSNGYANYGSGGGGSGAGGLGNGIAAVASSNSGASFSMFGGNVSGSLGANGAAAGAGSGGNGAYYDAGTNSRLIAATDGVVPAGGGGGGYTGERSGPVVTEGRGARGQVDVSY